MNTWVSVIAAAIAFVVTWVGGIWFIPFLHKLKYGQTILDIGPKWHKATKQGIPTMGGIIFIAGITLSFICGIILLNAFGIVDSAGANKLETMKAISGLVMAVLFSFMGFLDDFIKVKKKQNEGLTVFQKIFFQVMIISAYFASLYLSGDTSTSVKMPFFGELDLGLLYFPIMGVIILYIVNAVNLTDGIDGLCPSITFVYAAVFAVICGILGFTSQGVLCYAIGGGMLGFLMWNWHPAKVIMGDTGSMYLGGLVCAVGIGCNAEILMIIAGMVYIFEALSVVIQVIYFKATRAIYKTKEGKRFFKMTPIHHHFELSGWKEEKIVCVFSLISLILGICAVLLVQYF